ncbi:phosphoenolpyruvate synthase regulatory protein [mine drainage metagenome]|uniref:Phosphoenolpyruvate synthase regulatory protein n=1 Tax=mine drainage metagenome TaxID=410659 RepID=A0A1J5PV24_9ZZZZ
MPKRSVFFISDGTGITAETLGLSLLAHFADITFQPVRLPFTDSMDKARSVLPRVTAAQIEDGDRPILVMTIVNPEVRDLFEKSGALCLDLFGTFIRPLSAEFGQVPLQGTGMARRTATDEYHDRIDAIHFSLGHDDGLTPTGLDDAEVVLVGVSRSGKTPTSLYLAMQFGIRAANYPLIPEDLERMTLPGELARHREKLFGLTIAPDRLHRVRSERRPGSQYASLENCRREIRAAETLMRRENIPWLDSSSRSVEEIATMILQQMKLQ